MKQKPFLYVLIALIALTLLSAMVSNSEIVYAKELIMILAALKFLAVAFYFMELKQSNRFWKVSLVSFLTIFISLFLII